MPDDLPHPLFSGSCRNLPCAACLDLYRSAVEFARRFCPDDPGSLAGDAIGVALQRFDPRVGRFGPWLRGIIYRLARAQRRQEWRWQSRHVAMPEETEFEDDSASGLGGMFAHLEQVEWSRDLTQALAQLDPEDQRLLALRYWYDLSIEDCTQHFTTMNGKPTCSCIKSRAARALGVLQSMLQAHSPRPSCPTSACPRRRRHRSRRHRRAPRSADGGPSQST